eukprot:5184121-Prymnesium_polylepis.2
MADIAANSGISAMPTFHCTPPREQATGEPPRSCAPPHSYAHALGACLARQSSRRASCSTASWAPTIRSSSTL